MNREFKVGDIVMIVPGTRFYILGKDGCVNNPTNIEGVIEHVDSDYDVTLPYQMVFSVRWRHGFSNSYGISDLMFADNITKYGKLDNFKFM